LSGIYKEYPPHPLLIPYIETYWASNGFTDREIKQRILPDGCVDIIFSFNSQTVFPFIVGTMTSFFDAVYKGNIKLFGIRFRPGGITAFTHIPISEFTDMQIDIHSTETILDKYFFDEIGNCSTTKNIASCIDNYFLQKLPVLFLPDRQITYAIDLIEQTKGNISSIALLADKACLSERQFERRFKASTGVSPKIFNRIIRFKHLSRMLKDQPQQSLFETAIECGYYDHAHLIKELKRLSGYKPREL